MSRLKDILIEKGAISGKEKDPVLHLLEDPAVSEIIINGPLDVYARRNGSIKKEHTSFRDEAHIAETLDRLEEEFKVIRTETRCGLCAVVRKRSLLTPKRLVDSYVLVGDEYKLLKDLVRGRANIMISGLPGTSKSSVLNALLEEAANDIVVLVDPAGEIAKRPNFIVVDDPAAAPDLAVRLRADSIVVNGDLPSSPGSLSSLLDTVVRGVRLIFTIDAYDEIHALNRMVLKLTQENPGTSLDFLERLLFQSIDAGVHMKRRQYDGVAEVYAVTELILGSRTNRPVFMLLTELVIAYSSASKFTKRINPDAYITSDFKGKLHDNGVEVQFPTYEIGRLKTKGE